MTLSRYLGAVLAAAAVLLAVLAVAGARAAGPAPLEPNDPYWRQSWSQYLLRMPEVWARTTGSADVVIATVDTGVDASIQDLQGQLVPGWDFVANDAVPRDTVGHGTHVASVMVAAGNNGSGIAGYCWGCRVMPVRITKDGNATGPQIAQGVYWAVAHGARIITIGLNSGDANFDEEAAMKYARQKGVLVIASAGNTGTTGLRYPASYSGVLPVAATNDSNILYFWSSRGTWVPIAAPGCQLVLDAAVGPGTLCGTSFTPAVIAGIAGLLLSVKPSLTPDEIVSTLVSTSVPVSGIGGGRIDPVAALNAVAPLQAPTSSNDTGTSGTPVGTTAGQTPTVTPVWAKRSTELRTGIMRSRLSRFVRVGKGRLDIHLLASRARECQVAIALQNGEYVLSVFPPGDPNLLSMSEEVRAGRHRVDITCDSKRRRSYQLEISAVAPPAKKVKASA